MTKNKIYPFGDRIYLKYIKQEVESKFQVKENQLLTEVADVIAVGPDVKNVRAGDRLMMNAWADDIIEHDGVKYHFTVESAEFILAHVNRKRSFWDFLRFFINNQ
jgi:co-chaperonin GroES (HSP10)